MSGVKGLVGENWPPTVELVSSLQRLGRPCPDSRTNTSNRCELPRNATAVGKFRPLLNTETWKPGGTTMSSPLPGLKKTSSPGQRGFPAATTTVGWVSSSVSATVTSNQLNRSTLLGMYTPSRCAAFFARRLFHSTCYRESRHARVKARWCARLDATAGGDHEDTLLTQSLRNHSGERLDISGNSRCCQAGKKYNQPCSRSCSPSSTNCSPTSNPSATSVVKTAGLREDHRQSSGWPRRRGPCATRCRRSVRNTDPSCLAKLGRSAEDLRALVSPPWSPARRSSCASGG